MKLKQIIVAILVSVSLSCSAQEKDWNKIRIGVESAYPPFSMATSDGGVAGFDIDIANALCDQMQAECELIVHDFDALIPSLKAKKIDAVIASMSITEERKKVVSFSNKYYNTPAKFVKAKSSDIEITTEGLKGKVIGVQNSTTHDTFVSAKFPDAEIRRYTTLDEAYLDAQNGRLDLIIADSVPLSDGFLTKEIGAEWEFIGPDYTEQQYFGEGIGVAVRQKDNGLREKINQAISDIRENGTYEKINAEYFDFDIYGG